MFDIRKKSFSIGGIDAFIETGKIARQASSSAIVRSGDTVVMSTIVIGSTPIKDCGMLALSVDYIEKAYAAGKIPGGFFKREGRPSEREIIVSRLIDRSIRPNITKGFDREIHLVSSVLSYDPNIDPDMLALISASTAVALSDLPFHATFAGIRIGYIDGQFLINPSIELLSHSELDLVVVGTKDNILMVEASASELDEAIVREAIIVGHKTQQVIIESIEELKSEIAKPTIKWEFEKSNNNEILDKHKEDTIKLISDVYKSTDKAFRKSELKIIKDKLLSVCLLENPEITANEVNSYVFNIEKQVIRSCILDSKPRIDGRSNNDIRAIDIELGLLPRAHGSALFTRGETQSLSVVTLGTNSDAKITDGLSKGSKEQFMLHYNMPPYATGDIGRIGSPKRREIGHANLAKNAMKPVMPTIEEFPYTIRLVSEITESNGSSSMATVCGGCLAMMDAGIPIKKHVAGIAMGLIMQDNKCAVLTDILGDEDYLGDMDFKVAGTEDGITALQMDIKVSGINHFIIKEALERAKNARIHILSLMKGSINKNRVDVSEYAPKILHMSISVDKIHLIIGKGGSTIRSIIEESGANLDIDDSGMLTISSDKSASIDAAKKRIKELVADLELGSMYEAKVTKILDFGLVVDLITGKDGLLHVSQIPNNSGSKNLNDRFKDGDIVKVKLLSFDDKGRPRLTAKLESET